MLESIPVPQEQIEHLQRLIDQSRHMVFFGGAGVSTESGLVDFRGQNGAYNTPSEIPLEQVYSHDFFFQRTDEFYKIYRDRIRCPSAFPCAAHKKLAELERAGKLKTIITQNTDNFHQDAGSRNVIELHGSVYRNYCTRCGAFYDIGYMIDAMGTPYCRHCGGVIKPDVVLYQERVKEEDKQAAREAIAAADFLLVGGPPSRCSLPQGSSTIFRGSTLPSSIATPPITTAGPNWSSTATSARCFQPSR